MKRHNFSFLFRKKCCPKRVDSKDISSELSSDLFSGAKGNRSLRPVQKNKRLVKCVIVVMLMKWIFSRSLAVLYNPYRMYSTNVCKED